MPDRTRVELSENIQIQLATEWLPTYKFYLLYLQMALDYAQN